MIHKMRALKKRFCKFCKLSKITTQEIFDEHLTLCERETTKRNDNPVSCAICLKICPNPKAFGNY